MSERVKPTKSQELYKQKLELMTYRDDFQTEINFIRKRFGIPDSGFPDFKTCGKWAQEITTSSEPEKSVKKDPMRAYAKLREGTLFSSEYEKVLSRLMKTLDIDNRWFEAVEYYLLFNKTDAHQMLPKSVVVELLAEPKTNKQKLYLQITADTEQRDIIEWWSTVQKFQGILRSNSEIDYSKSASEILKKIKSIDPVPYVAIQEKKKDRKKSSLTIKKCRDAYLLRSEGKSYNEIKKVIGCAQNEVGMYIGRYKKMIRNNRLD